ncbi:RNA polymerase sigma factor SigJ [Actinoplanes sp. NPDC051861]|uniref:RNA polymerase sigma factor SigJ n=1 Tax=Actinoplanes sp. NPDC051861 TaxID=3155170 RepID=UPI00344488DE
MDDTAYRPLLFSIAYGMTGSVGDAEDIVQDAFLGAARARRDGTTILDPKAYLTTTVTRLGMNHLRSARVRRETYVGNWLPEPVVVPADGTGPAEHAELADSLSMAFLVLLENLTPLERAVFMLHEVFGFAHAEVAGIVGKTEVNCRQIFARSRARIAAHTRLPAGAARRSEGAELARRFFAAVTTGDLEALLETLAPEVTSYGDGGGKAPALATPLSGRDEVARFLIDLFRRTAARGVRVQPSWVNGRPGAVLRDRGGNVLSVLELHITGGRIQALHGVVNPDKLTHVGGQPS